MASTTTTNNPPFLGDERLAGIFGAGTHALEDADDQQQGRRPVPDGVEGGQDADDGRRDAHQHEGEDQGLLPADLVTHRAED
jgi:hypothetical protein